MLSTTALQSMYGKVTQNTSSDNLSIGLQWMNIEHRYLLQNFFSNEATYSIVTVAQQQAYKLPPDYSKLKTGTLTIGNLRWTPTEILNRQAWDNLNVFPYYADIPTYFFIYQNQFNFWPIPSSNGNTITFNYKRRIPDLSLTDYSTGTVSVANGATAVTGSGTAFIPTTNTVNESRWIQFPENTGDNLWYQVASVDSATGITLYAPYTGITISGGTYVLGQMPILIEDFQDMLVWKAASIYFSSIVDNPKKKEEFEALYNTKLRLLEEYAGTKTINVNLSRPHVNRNPNLYPQSLS